MIRNILSFALDAAGLRLPARKPRNFPLFHVGRKPVLPLYVHLLPMLYLVILIY